jgi:glycine dehydrogenase subunit 1
MRYLPHTPADRAALLAAIGVPSVDALFKDVPRSAHLSGPIAGLPLAQGEIEVERHLTALAKKNLGTSAAPSFLGAGAYRHHIPAAVDHLIQRGEFLTSYTPYQPEISQGTLQMLFEFQTMVCQLTGMEVANASMYDGATAAAEAVAMAQRITGRASAVLSGGLHPHTRDIIITQADWTSHQAVVLPPDSNGTENLLAHITDQTACVVVQYPAFFGHLADHTALAAACHAKGALLIVSVTEIIALGLLPPPGEMGADIVVAEGQSLGNPLGFGGPYVGLLATREKFIRQMPGRICGETVDAEGRRGFVLTLSTREQHIRREKATSNICTNAGLCALAFTIHLSLLGEQGFTQLARINHAKACELADALAQVSGVEVVNSSFFNEFCVRLSQPAAAVVETLAAKGILAGVPVSRLYPNDDAYKNLLLVAATELTTSEDIAALCAALREVLI